MGGQRNILRASLASLWLVASGVIAGSVSAETALIMAEEKGCIWCTQWNRDVAPEYPITAEGLAAPLRRIDIHAPYPDDIAFDRAIRFTPTFVLVKNGQELSRIEGYPGEDFFWGLLQMMLDDAQISFEAEG